MTDEGDGCASVVGEAEASHLVGDLVHVVSDLVVHDPDRMGKDIHRGSGIVHNLLDIFRLSRIPWDPGGVDLESGRKHVIDDRINWVAEFGLKHNPPTAENIVSGNGDPVR